MRRFLVQCSSNEDSLEFLICQCPGALVVPEYEYSWLTRGRWYVRDLEYCDLKR